MRDTAWFGVGSRGGAEVVLASTRTALPGATAVAKVRVAIFIMYLACMVERNGL